VHKFKVLIVLSSGSAALDKLETPTNKTHSADPQYRADQELIEGNDLLFNIRAKCKRIHLKCENAKKTTTL
jgi:hypothetical protein